MGQFIKIQQIPSMLNICSYSQKPSSFKKINWLVVIMMCLFFLPQVTRTQFSYQLMITTSTSMASNKADYTFEVLQQDDITVTSTTNVQIVLPVQYQGVMNDGSFVCYVSTWVDGLPIPTISCLLSGLTFTINGLFTSLSAPLLVPSFTFYGFVINQITNPMYAATTAAFTGLFIETATSAALFTFSTNFGSSGIQISESILTCSISSSPTTTTSSPSTMIVSVTPIAMIPLNTTLTIQMLKYWPANAFNTTTIMSSINCQSGTNTSANIQCSMVIKPTAIQIIVTNVVSQDISGGVVFYINSIINPPTIQPQNSIDIIAKKDGTKLMGRCSGNKMNGITAINFLTASYSVTNSSVNAVTSAFLLFKISSVVITSDTIKITLPSSISAVSSLSQLIITNGNYTNYSPSVTYSPSSQTTLVVTTGASSNPGSSIEVQLYNVKNPPSQAVTGSIGLQLLRNGFLMQKLDIISTPLQFKARRANMLATLTISTTQIGVAADYTFSLQLKNQIGSSGQGVVIIYFPSAFNASVTASSSCNPTCLSLDTTRAVISASSLNLTSSSLSCSIQLLSILNPAEVGQTTSFWINTLYTNTNALSIVDQITSGLSVVLTSRQISSVTLLTSSNVVYFYPATYSFTAVNSNPIPAFSSILLLIPSAIVVGEAGVSCMLGTRAVPCSYNSTAHSITVTSLSASSIGAGALSTLSVSNLFNPASTAPTSSFKFYIVNPYSQIIEHKESGIIFTATTATQFSTISLQSNSVTNSDGNTSMLISFSLNMQQGYVNNSLLLISMPTHISGISSISCLVVSPNLLSVSCTKSSSTIKARLTFNSLTAGDQVAIKIQYYINYPSIQPYSISLTLFTSPTEQFKIAQNTIINVNSQLSSLAIQSYSFSSTILSQPTVFTFSITPTYYGTDLAEVWVTLPQQFSLSTPSCSSIPPSLTCNIVGRVFKIAETTSTYSWVMPLQISLSGVIAPTFSPSTSITIETRSNTGYLMSRSTQPKFLTSCTLPCRTCLTTDLSHCLSCYSDPTLVSSKIILSGTQCVSACNNRQYYNNNTNQCDSCSSVCQLCIDYSYCTSCPIGNYLDRVGHTCVSDCSFGFYKSNVYTCQACNSALFCASCSNQHSCLTCLSGYYLYQNLCVQTCPAPITYSNSILNICQSCPTNCTKCSGSVTFSSSTVACTECTVGYLLDTSTTRCFQQCLVPGTVPSGNQCVSCQSPCLTCSLTPTNCTTCDVSSSNKYFHNNRCLSLCPSLYYPSDSSYTCVLCTSPCQTCTSGSVNSCISCVTNYYLLGSTCVQSCPNLYYNNVYRCSPCVSPCLNCLSELQCSSCISGRYLYGTNCVTTCDPGMTIINGNQCLVCAPSCRTCSTSSYCTSCYPTNYLFNGTCSITCVATTYADNSQQLCLPCTAPCKDCSSSSYCITCINTALVIENGLCLAACTSPLIPVNSICTSCNSACSTCVNSITNCVICQSGYYFHSNLVGVNCVSSCSTGYIYDNRTTSGNYECLSNCPSSHYNTGLGTQCLPCDVGCQICTSSFSNCSLCISNYYLTALTSTCSQTCPTNSPYPTLYTVNTSSSYGVCEICNKTICNSCEFLHSCGTCPSGKILVYEGITSRINSTIQNKTCISNCPTNYSYNNTQLLCLVSQSTNSSNTTTNSTSTISQSYKIIPNYLFSIVGACVLPVVAISKYQVPTTSLQISLYAIVIVGATAALAHTFYFQINELFYIASARLLETQNYVNVLGLNVQVDNPTTILAFLPVMIHILGTIVLLLGLACIRDYSFIPIIQQHPIFSIFMLILFFFQYKLIWILSSGMFGFQVTMVKYCKEKMVKLLQIITLIGVAELIMQTVYAVYIIVLVVNTLNSSQTARLLLSNSQLPSSVTYLHPYIQLVIFSGLGLFLSMCLLLTHKSQYFIQQVPEINQTFFKEKQNLTKKTKLSQNNQSMNQLLSDKDAVFKRFNSDQILRDIDDAAMIVSVDEKQNDYLHDFGVTKVPTERSRLKSSKAEESRLSKISKISKVKQVETAQIDIQANMDQLMLPYINEEQQIKTEHKQEGLLKQVQNKNLPTNTKNQNQNQNLLNPLSPHQEVQKQIQVQQEKEVLKSQPSWSSFKLGSKHKYQLEEDRQYLGYVCTTQNGLKQEGWSGNTQIYDAQGDIIVQKITSKNPEHKMNSQIQRQSKTIMKFEEEEDIMQSEDFDQQYKNSNQTKFQKEINNKQSALKVIDHGHEDESGLDQISEQQIYDYHIKKENSEESRNEDSIQNKKPIKQQVAPIQIKRNQIFDMQEEQYEEEINLSKQTQQLDSHKNDEEKEYQQDNLSVLVEQYTERDKDDNKEQSIKNSEATHKQSQQNVNKQLSNMSEQQEKVNLKTNRLFYLDETDKFNNEELLSQNLPSQYKNRIPSEESEPFTPFQNQHPSESDNHAVEQIGSQFGYNIKDDNQEKVEQQKDNLGDQNIGQEEIKKNNQEDNIIYDQKELGGQEQDTQKDEQVEQKNNKQNEREQSSHVKVDNQIQRDEKMSGINKSQKSESKEVKDKADEQMKEKQLKENEQVEQLNMSVKKINKNPESLLARLKGKRGIRKKNEESENKQFNELNSNNQVPLNKQSTKIKNKQIQEGYQQLKDDQQKVGDKRQMNNGKEDEKIGQSKLDDKLSEKQSLVKVQLQEKSSVKSKKQQRNSMKKIEEQNQENDNKIIKSDGIKNSVTKKVLNESELQKSNAKTDMKQNKQQRNEKQRQQDVKQNKSITKQIENGKLHQSEDKQINIIADQQKFEVDSLKQKKSVEKQQNQKDQQQKQNLYQDHNNKNLEEQNSELKNKEQQHQEADIATEQKLKELQNQELNKSKEKFQRGNLIKVENQKDNKDVNKNNLENKPQKSQSLKKKDDNLKKSKIIGPPEENNSKNRQAQQVVQNDEKKEKKEQEEQQRLNQSIRQLEREKQIKNQNDQVNGQINEERNLQRQGTENQKLDNRFQNQKPIELQFDNEKRSQKKDFEEQIQQKSKNVSVDTPVKQNIGHNLKQEESSDLKNIAMELLKSKHRSQRSQLPINLKKTQKIIQTKQKKGDQVYIQDAQHKSQFPFRNKKEQQKKIEIQYDDAQHFNETHEPYKKQSHNSDIIFKVPSEMGASLLIVDDDQPFHDQEDIILDIQQPQQKLSSQNGEVSQKEVIKQKGITFIEDLNQLDEMVKTPIRFSTKNVTRKIGTLQNDDATDAKPSDLIYNKRSTFIGENKIKQNKQSLGGIGQSKKARVQLTFGNRKQRNQSNVNVIYEEQDKDYDDHQSIKQSKQQKHTDLKDKRMAMLLEKQKVGDQIAGSNDKKPSAMLRGSFKKIGEMLMKGDRQG